MKNNVFEKRRRAWQTIGDDLIKTKEINKELLEALEKLVWASYEVPPEYITAAKSAIAKARGEQ